MAPPSTPSARPTAQRAALLAVAITVVTWGCSSVVIKFVSTTGLVASFYRLWLAIPVLWVLPVVMPSLRWRPRREWAIASLIGGGLFSVHQVLFFTSLKLTRVANVALIGALQPALVLLVAGPLFAEAITPRAIAWAGVALAGTVAVVLSSAGAPGWSPLGDALAIGNLFAFTAYFLVSKRIRARLRTTEYLVGMTTVSAVIMLAVAVAGHLDVASPRGWDWPLLLFLALVSGTLGHFLTNWAHAHTSAFVVSIMLLGVPVIAAVGAAILLGEALSPGQIAGGAVVLLAIFRLTRATGAATSEELAASAAETDAP